VTAVADVTSLLLEYRDGDRSAMDRLLPIVYDELHSLARGHRNRWSSSSASGTTSLVHEAYLKLVDQTQVEWQNRRHFFYIASRAIRSILVDNARYHQRQKRGGGLRRVELEDSVLVSEQRCEELLALDSALDRLRNESERLCRIVECRFFGGLTVDETADTLEVSPATVKRGWNLARVWLYRRLESEQDEGGVAENAG